MLPLTDTDSAIVCERDRETDILTLFDGDIDWLRLFVRLRDRDCDGTCDADRLGRFDRDALTDTLRDVERLGCNFDCDRLCVLLRERLRHRLRPSILLLIDADFDRDRVLLSLRDRLKQRLNDSIDFDRLAERLMLRLRLCRRLSLLDSDRDRLWHRLALIDCDSDRLADFDTQVDMSRPGQETSCDLLWHFDLLIEPEREIDRLMLIDLLRLMDKLADRDRDRVFERDLQAERETDTDALLCETDRLTERDTDTDALLCDTDRLWQML